MRHFTASARILFLAPLMILAAAPATMFAQGLNDLQQGVRVRIEREEGKPAQGILQGVANDSLRYYVDDPAQVEAVPVHQVRAVKISEGKSRGRGALKHGAVGLLIGGVTGYALGYLTYEDNATDTWCILACSASEAGAVVGILFGGGGLALGSIVGLIRGDESWRTVYTSTGR